MLPSFFGLSCFEDLDTVVRQPITYGEVIRALRNFEGANRRYCDLQMCWFKKVEAFIKMLEMERPLERYLHLAEKQPWVLELASGSDVAGYLGISPLLLALFKIGMSPMPIAHKNSP